MILMKCQALFYTKLRYSKISVQWPLSKRSKIVFQELSLNAGQKDCRILQGEHSAILLTFIKLPFVIKIFVLPIFEWPFHTGFTVLQNMLSAEVVINRVFIFGVDRSIRKDT